MRHLSARDLAACIAGGGTPEQLAHAKACAACAERAATVRELIASQRGDARVTYRYVRRLGARVRREAAAAVDALMAEPHHRWPLLARSDASVATTFALDEMLRRAIPMMYSDPHRARALGAAADEALRRLSSVGAVEPSLACRVFRDVAAIEKYCGSLDTALAAIERARTAAELSLDADYERAVVDLLPARWACDPDVDLPIDALTLIHRCERVLRERGDERLLTITAFTRAALLLRDGRIAEAAETYQAIIAAAEARGSSMEVASARDPLAYALVGLGRAGEAVTHAQRAVDLFTSKGQTIPAALARRTLAVAYDAAGRSMDALAAIGEAAAALKAAGDIDSFIRAELVRVRILLDLDAHVDVTNICTAIAIQSSELDLTKPTRRRTATAEALAYLRQAAAANVITTSIVDDVADFLAGVDRGTAKRFVPRLPLLPM